MEGFAIRRNKLQLVGVSAMFIASKVEEMYAPEINDFVYITDNAYTAAEIRQMELRMLNTLGFNFSRPLPLHFLRRNSKAGDVDVLQHTVAKYLIEMSLLEYDMAHVPPSLMAAAALFLSLRLVTNIYCATDSARIRIRIHFQSALHPWHIKALMHFIRECISCNVWLVYYASPCHGICYP